MGVARMKGLLTWSWPDFRVTGELHPFKNVRHDRLGRTFCQPAYQVDVEVTSEAGHPGATLAACLSGCPTGTTPCSRTSCA